MGRFPKKTTPGTALFFGLGMLLVLSPLPGAALASSEKELQSNRLKLNQTLKSLSNESRELQTQQGLEEGLLGELEHLDQQLTDLATQKELLAGQVHTAREELPKLATEIESLQTEQKKIRADLLHHVRLMYGLGSQGMLKVVFSQENTSKARQGILYYGQLIRARNDQFHRYTANLENLRQITENHKSLLAKTQTLADDLANRLVQLEQKKQERAQLLASVREKKNLHQQKVLELQRARGILGSFVEKLHSTLDPLPAAPPEPQAPTPSEPKPDPSPTAAAAPSGDQATTNQEFERITQKKGHLNPPIANRPGQNRPPGLFYPVENDTAIKAVYRGQVVYADWFRGYGLLVILNHGDHVYSLYGHNRKLLVTPGDWVEAQETIAESGDTGSLEGVSGLYFEIRDKGQSVNPRIWLGS
ncbi:MAG: peptidoglycan DD-metalloendopeptidase family protein [Magnetococcales bacterium]|nr:peptidoglycan DD-metalloendopeptidase family protein [Magnetococcales bacterium]MBF0632438.1 peptidoglycan DD-metalloendopeptidase family protein [Magnetococcales bacterium]